MKLVKKITFTLIFMFSFLSYGKNIMIGDQILLKVKGTSIMEIEKAFDQLSKEKEIVIDGINVEPDGSVVAKFRSFSIGENDVKIGNKSVKFIVSSSLTEEEQKSENKEIFLNMSDKSDQNLYWEGIPSGGIIGISILLCLFIRLIKKLEMKKKLLKENPYEKFENGMKLLSKDKWQYEISYLLREFIDYKYKSHFLNGEYKEIGNIKREDIEFIAQLDNYKFAPKNKDLNAYVKKISCKAYEIYNKIKEVKE
ncbi:hypothetical protein [Fusobacterium sp. PH5-44]|uniref:hypothetical protein n=1 Tax=unclassified Fusobacterium TaxID=2648384 RepID=UPI003D1A8034